MGRGAGGVEASVQRPASGEVYSNGATGAVDSSKWISRILSSRRSWIHGCHRVHLYVGDRYRSYAANVRREDAYWT